MTYTIEVVEILSRYVTVDTDSPQEAEDLVRDMYSNNEIVLTFDDYIGTDFFQQEE